MAMLSMREAFGHASARDQGATHQAIEDAHHHFNRINAGDDDPAWVQYFDRTRSTCSSDPDAQPELPLVLRAADVARHGYGPAVVDRSGLRF
ncbi:hypothetical protein [Streptacidiphilus sp. MAP5-3]|uniref:hypothetical protein n=1 Tax=unclassified Streptacidiphilus TaxID=2643834 RepID=UPI0035173886